MLLLVSSINHPELVFGYFSVANSSHKRTNRLKLIIPRFFVGKSADLESQPCFIDFLVELNKQNEPGENIGECWN